MFKEQRALIPPAPSCDTERTNKAITEASSAVREDVGSQGFAERD